MKDWGTEKEYLHNTRQNLWNRDYFEFLVKQVWKIDRPVKIIDFGCGYGFLAQLLLPIVPEGSTYRGIDISERLIEDAKEIFAGHEDVASFEVMDLNKYEPDAAYDIAICQAVLRHLSNPEEILKKMIGSVTQEGLVICIEPSRRMENAGIFIDSEMFDPFEHDDFLRNKWISEEQSGERDYQIGIKIPVFMKKLGLKDVGVRINDYVDFLDREINCENFESEKARFIAGHGLDEKYDAYDTFIAARCHVISYGTRK